jgi:hypothetical protein
MNVLDAKGNVLHERDRVRYIDSVRIARSANWRGDLEVIRFAGTPDGIYLSDNPGAGDTLGLAEYACFVEKVEP